MQQQEWGGSHDASRPVVRHDIESEFPMSVIHRPGPPLVIGHRGADAVRPENTIASFEHAIALGVDAIEFDVRLSVDGVALVHHDPDTSRTCGTALSIEGSRSADLRALDAGETFARADWQSTDARIPLLDEVLELTRDLPLIIECKTVAAVAPVVRALAAHDASHRAVVGSFLDAAMIEARAAGVRSGAARGDMIGLVLRNLIRLAPRAVPFDVMCIPERASGITLPIARLARWGRGLGVPVHVWTVNRADDANRLWDVGVTGIISDDPATILAARAARSIPARAVQR